MSLAPPVELTVVADITPTGSLAASSELVSGRSSSEDSVDGGLGRSDEKSISWSGKPFLTNFKILLASVTVEPVAFMYTVCSMVTSLLSQSLLLEKACRVNLNYTDETCHELQTMSDHSMADIEEDVEKVSAGILEWKTPLEFTFPIVFILFLGPWTDRHGRKLALILPILGLTLMDLGLVLNAIMDNWAAEIVGIFLAVPSTLTGSTMTFYMAIYSFITDVSSVQSRTCRVGVITTFTSMGSAIGLSLTGILHKSLGFPWVFAAAACVGTLNVLYIVLWVHDVKRPQNDSQSCFCADFFDIKNMVDVVKNVIKKRKSTMRLELHLIFIIILLSFFPYAGEGPLMYMFTRTRLNWNEMKYGLYGTYRMFVAMIGTLFVSGVLSYKLKLRDVIVAISSVICHLTTCLIYAFTSSDWQMFVASLAEMCNGTIFISRSMATKIVMKDEIGQTNAFITCIESLTPLVTGPLYTEIYASTLEYFPGAFFLLSVGVLFVPYVLLLCLFVLQQQREMTQQSH